MPREARPGILRWFAASAGVLVASFLLAEVVMRVYAARGGLPVGLGYEGLDRLRFNAWVEDVREYGEVDPETAELTGGLPDSHEFHPVLGWVPSPNLVRHQAPEVLTPYSTNSLGMRGREEFELEKPAGYQRVALIGDSFTFGLDKRDKHIWARLLADRLDPVEVLNFGVSGYGTGQALLCFEERALPFEPDVVVLGLFVPYCVTRSTRSFTSYAKPRFELVGDRLEVRGLPVPEPAELVRRAEEFAPASYALHFLRWTLDTATARGDEPVERPETLALNRAILSRTQEVVEDSGAELVVVMIPTSGWPGSEASELERDVHAWSRAAEVPLVDMREVFEEHSTQDHTDGLDREHYVPEFHLTKLGHEVLAEELVEAFEREGAITRD